MSIFTHQTVIELYHTDAMGVIFYPKLCELVHQTFSAFLRKEHLSIASMINQEDYLCPVVHFEGEIKKPLKVDDAIEVHMDSITFGNTSMTLRYQIVKNQIDCARAKVVHVFVNNQMQPIEVPKVFKNLEVKEPLSS